MSSREARLEKVIRLRDERLERALLAQAQAQVSERNAAEELRRAAERRQQAEAARRELASRGASLLDFLEAEEWLATCSSEEQRATVRAKQARVLLQKAEERTRAAHIELKQLEQLKQRWAQAKQLSRARSERRNEDEIAQRLVRARGSRNPR